MSRLSALCASFTGHEFWDVNKVRFSSRKFRGDVLMCQWFISNTMPTGLEDSQDFKFGLKSFSHWDGYMYSFSLRRLKCIANVLRFRTPHRPHRRGILPIQLPVFRALSFSMICITLSSDTSAHQQRSKRTLPTGTSMWTANISLTFTL